MVRRVLTDSDVRYVDESRVVVRRSVASILASVVTTVYAAVVTIIGLDALLEALGARRTSGFVGFVDALADPLLAPFRGAFGDQRYWATALLAAVVYTIVYLLCMAALRRDRPFW